MASRKSEPAKLKIEVDQGVKLADKGGHMYDVAIKADGRSGKIEVGSIAAKNKTEARNKAERLVRKQLF